MRLQQVFHSRPVETLKKKSPRRKKLDHIPCFEYYSICPVRTGKLVRIQHGPATVTGDERYSYGHRLRAAKAVVSRTTRKSGYLNML